MRLNENIRIVGKNVILIPYEAKHVKKYHNWMQTEELQNLTASMPLSLNEEYEMQMKWRDDGDKCTFLILCRSTYESTHDEIHALVGDTNLFIHDNDGEKCAEAEIMIAEISARGKGYGLEAMLLMLKYGQEKLNIKKYVAKIGMENERSLRLFKKIQFEEVSKSDVFREVTLERKVSEDWLTWLNKQVTLNCTAYKD